MPDTHFTDMAFFLVLVCGTCNSRLEVQVFQWRLISKDRKTCIHTGSMINTCPISCADPGEDNDHALTLTIEPVLPKSEILYVLKQSDREQGSWASSEHVHVLSRPRTRNKMECTQSRKERAQTMTPPHTWNYGSSERRKNMTL